ncbi:Putative pentatricopeptide repeat-containing protein At3g23330 [Linum perenne]
MLQRATSTIRHKAAPSSATLSDYSLLLNASNQSKSLSKANLIHQTHLTTFAPTSHPQNSGKVEHAPRVFDEIPQRPRGVIQWNNLIRSYAWNGPFEKSVDLYYEMLDCGITPNKYTFPFVLKACSALQAVEEGRAIHAHAKRVHLDSDVYVSTALVDTYLKCGCVSEAMEVFDGMPSRDVVAWNSMISGFCLRGGGGDYNEVIRLFVKMQEDVSPNSSTIVGILPVVAQAKALRHGKGCLHCYIVKTGSVFEMMVGNTLLSMYAKCGVIDDASRFFDEMLLKDAVTYAAIISGYVQNGYAEEALRMFYKLQRSGIDPDMATMTGILPACSHLAALQHGYCSHSYAIVHGFTASTIVCNALIDMYAKCGKINTARKVFDTMKKRDVISWNSMIDAYGIHGLGKDALSLFEEMQVQGIGPDDVTFICLLSACGHSGLVDEGKHWFSSMTRDFGIIPRIDHYICMTDLLSRAGLLDEVYKFIQDMPFKPDVRIWGSVLASCKIHKNIELGERVSKEIERLGPESTGNFVLLSNMYSTIGRWDDAAQVRLTQKEMGFKKSPGCSWIEIDGTIHAFVGGDRSHPLSQQINKKLDELQVEMKKLGYTAESSYVFQDVEEEEKDTILLYHSEKLAIAFGILSLSPSKPILVTKNLRVCGDCHSAIKLISLITKRDITVRDASRFHHFKDGNCNCGDFW